MKQVGIFSGTFDPIHNGHIALAQAAQKEAKLDKVHIVIEKNPRNKQDVTDYVQRRAMVEIALRKVKYVELLELKSEQFSVDETLPELLEKFEDAKLFLIQGSDTASCLDCWPGIDLLARHFDFIVGRRDELPDITNPSFIQVQILKTKLPAISSGQIRTNPRKAFDLINPVVGKYIETQKLYEDSSTSSSFGSSK